MDQVKIGIIQMSMVEDQQKNLDKAVKMIGEAAKKGAQIVCLPELFSSLYFPKEKESSVQAEPIPGPTSERLSKIAKQNKVVIVSGSIYEKDDDKSYNTSVVFDENGKIVGKYRKVHIPQDSGFYEQDYFDAGNSYHVFDTKYGKIGVLICFDQWYPEPARVSKLMGADIIFYPTAIGTINGVEQTEGNWQEAWENVQKGHAIANSVIVATANRVGTEGDTNFWGGSFVVDQFGKTLVHADDTEGVYMATCDLNLAKDVEKGWGFLKNRRPDTYHRLVG